MLVPILVGALILATLTLWVPAYWPVALFEIAVFVLAAIAMARKRLPPREAYFPLLALSFVALWGCLQCITGWTINSFVTQRAICQWMTWAALYYLGASLLQQESLTQQVRTVIVWFGLVVSAEAILQAYLSPGKVFGIFPSGYHDFVMGPIVYHTHFAVFVETILPIALFRALNQVKKSYVFLGISAVLLAAMVVSASRGGLIIACAEVLAVLGLTHLRKPKSGRRIGLLALALLVATAVLTLIVGFETVSHRFQTDALIQGRLQFALSTLRMIAVHPLAGWGLGCWPAVYPAFATFDPGAIVNQAHSDWLQWFAEGGLPVGLAMLSLAVWAFKPAVRSIWGVGVLAVLLHAAFDYPFSRPAIGAWPILILSMAAVTRKSKGVATTQG
jgi:O-antigen ligase